MSEAVLETPPTPSKKARSTWSGMCNRCNPNLNTKVSFMYAKRGIRVCARWKSFKNFYADMGEPPSKDHSIDRINSNKGYSPSNCRWILKSENTARAIKKHRRQMVTMGFVFYNKEKTALQQMAFEQNCDERTVVFKIISKAIAEYRAMKALSAR